MSSVVTGDKCHNWQKCFFVTQHGVNMRHEYWITEHLEKKKTWFKSDIKSVGYITIYINKMETTSPQLKSVMTVLHLPVWFQLLLTAKLLPLGVG